MTTGTAGKEKGELTVAEQPLPSEGRHQVLGAEEIWGEQWVNVFTEL